MAIRYPTFFPRRASVAVRNMMGAGQVDTVGSFRAQFGAPIALDADGILDGQSIASAGSTTTLLRNDVPGRWGRNITVVASGAATSTVTINGFDYLNQRMTETLTLNGATAVQGAKCFSWVESVSFGSTAGTTIDVGWGNRFGLPFKGIAMQTELKNGAVSANGGTFVAGLANATTSTATNADTRGYYLPVTVVPDGTNTFDIIYVVDENNLHGNAPFAA
jgi:hypothetical protein